MKVVGGVALGPRERIVLLEIGDEWLVIGVVPGQIRTCTGWPKENALAGRRPARRLRGKAFYAVAAQHFGPAKQ
jgi:flagellar biogenesis protein FliO